MRNQNEFRALVQERVSAQQKAAVAARRRRRMIAIGCSLAVVMLALWPTIRWILPSDPTDPAASEVLPMGDKTDSVDQFLGLPSNTPDQTPDLEPTPGLVETVNPDGSTPYLGSVGYINRLEAATADALWEILQTKHYLSTTAMEMLAPLFTEEGMLSYPDTPVEKILLSANYGYYRLCILFRGQTDFEITVTFRSSYQEEWRPVAGLDTSFAVCQIATGQPYYTAAIAPYTYVELTGWPEQGTPDRGQFDFYLSLCQTMVDQLEQYPLLTPSKEAPMDKLLSAVPPPQ